MWTGLVWLRTGTDEFGIETSGSIKCCSGFEVLTAVVMKSPVLWDIKCVVC
jgi:hypothetical protein